MLFSEGYLCWDSRAAAEQLPTNIRQATFISTMSNLKKNTGKGHKGIYSVNEKLVRLWRGGQGQEVWG